MCELEELVEKLTMSGEANLDKKTLKSLTKICKKDDVYVDRVWELIWKKIRTMAHGEVRLSAMQLCDELFARSHVFRTRLLDNFNLFTQLTLELEPHAPPLLPRAAAARLKTTTLAAINNWNSKFGPHYKQLSLGVHYLKECKKVSFERGTVGQRAAEAQARQEARERHVASLKAERVARVAGEMRELRSEVEAVLTQLDNCLALLLPTLAAFNIFTHGEDDDSSPRCASADLLSEEWFTGIERDTTIGLQKEGKPPESGYALNRVKQEWDGDKTVPIAFSRDGYGEGEVKVDSQVEIAAGVELFDPHLEGCSLVKSVKQEVPLKEGCHTVTDISDTCTVGPASHPSPCSVRLNYGDKLSIASEDESAKSAPNRASSSSMGGSNEGPVSPMIVAPIKSEAADANYINGDCNQLPVMNLGQDQIVVVKIERDAGDSFTASALSGPNPNEMTADEQGCIHAFSNSAACETNGGEAGEDVSYHGSAGGRAHGLVAGGGGVTVTLQPDLLVTENQDNSAVLRTVAELRAELFATHAPRVHHWLEVFTKNGAEQSLLKPAIDLKQKLEAVQRKLNEINITLLPRVEVAEAAAYGDDSDDGDFEEVPDKEGFEPRVPPHLRREAGLCDVTPRAPHAATTSTRDREWSMFDPSFGDEDPTSMAAQLAKSPSNATAKSPSKATAKMTRAATASVSTAPSSDKHAAVPTVPFGTDLLHWGEKEVEPPLLVRVDAEHRFWAARPEGEVVDKEALSSMRERVINFTGHFTPVAWQCRAPLASGTLCRRMDRHKCPFHGLVVGRDKAGRPTDPADRQREEQARHARAGLGAGWEDRGLQREVEAATGHALVRRGRGGARGTQRGGPQPGLTKIGPSAGSSARRRLEKKVLNSRALKRVATSLDSIDRKKHKDKFGTQFNYQFH